MASNRKRKLRLYASHTIPEVWIVNLVDRRVEVFSDPHDGAYATTRICAANDAVELSFAPGRVIAVADILRPTD